MLIVEDRRFWIEAFEDVESFCSFWWLVGCRVVVGSSCVWRSEKGAAVLKVVASDSCRFALIDFRRVLFG